MTDVRRSARWYADALELELAAEFVEDGELRGVALQAPGFLIALRDRAMSASAPDLHGFDVVAFEVAERQDLDALAARWDDLGVEHSGVRDFGRYGVSIDVADPDGIVLRFLHDTIVGRDGFVGMSTDATGSPSFYDTPRHLP